MAFGGQGGGGFGGGGNKWIGVPWIVLGGLIAYRKSWFEEVGVQNFP
jgi:multiple sugar transport system substrate-binding protein